MDTQTETTCYRHPGRETRVSCSSCGRPICTDCMTPSPVGMRCPECARQTTKVKGMPATRAGGDQPRVTIALIVICVIAFLAEGSLGATGGEGDLFRDGALFGPAVDNGDIYRLVTAGFLHAGLLHIAFNMYLLYLLGQELEPELGSPRFAALYFASLLAGSFGALVAEPLALTVGASGAVYGLMGAMAAMLFARGVNPFQTAIGMLILLNLALSFVLPNVSIGGHIGGLVGGAIIGFAFSHEHGRRWLGWVTCAAVAAVSVFGAIAVA
jgi:membrane associated rhomboid family serine protease